ncbi:hypothetical protein [Aquamicrobium zhengzhouense]|nr:hypothetical protein [Aquamicrobium zhengzhouense]
MSTALIAHVEGRVQPVATTSRLMLAQTAIVAARKPLSGKA